MTRALDLIDAEIAWWADDRDITVEQARERKGRHPEFEALFRLRDKLSALEPARVEPSEVRDRAVAAMVGDVEGDERMFVEMLRALSRTLLDRLDSAGLAVVPKMRRVERPDAPGWWWALSTPAKEARGYRRWEIVWTDMVSPTIVYARDVESVGSYARFVGPLPEPPED